MRRARGRAGRCAGRGGRAASRAGAARGEPKRPHYETLAVSYFERVFGTPCGERWMTLDLDALGTFSVTRTARGTPRSTRTKRIEWDGIWYATSSFPGAVLEVQGKWHYIADEHRGGVDGFFRQYESDTFKKLWAERAGYIYIEIPNTVVGNAHRVCAPAEFDRRLAHAHLEVLAQLEHRRTHGRLPDARALEHWRVHGAWPTQRASSPVRVALAAAVARALKLPLDSHTLARPRKRAHSDDNDHDDNDDNGDVRCVAPAPKRARTQGISDVGAAAHLHERQASTCGGVLLAPARAPARAPAPARALSPDSWSN